MLHNIEKLYYEKFPDVCVRACDTKTQSENSSCYTGFSN